MFKSTKFYTKGAKERNEDYCYICSKFGFVIDGASGLDKVNIMDAESDAAWFSHYIGNQLEILLRRGDDLQKALIIAVDSAKSDYYAVLGDRELLPHQTPSASIAMFRMNGDIMEYLQLGDCTGVILFKDHSVRVIAEERHTRLDNQVIDNAVILSKTQKISVREAMSTTEITNQLIKNRQLKNTQGGYWILDITGDGIANAKMFKFNSYVIKAVLCCSDGFAQTVEGYGIYKAYIDLIKDCQKISLSTVAEELFLKQGIDADFSINPRFKPTDDTTAIYGEM